MLLNKFLDNAVEFRAGAEKYMATNQREPLNQVIHKITPNFNMIGAAVLFELSTDLYKKCNIEAPWEELVDGTIKVLKELSDVEIEIQNSVKQLENQE